MALTQDQVNWWFNQNPTASAEDVAGAVKTAGGLEAICAQSTIYRVVCGCIPHAYMCTRGTLVGRSR